MKYEKKHLFSASPMNIPNWKIKEIDGKEVSSVNIDVDDIEILEVDDVSSRALAAANIQKQPDLLYLRFKLVHEGLNRNQDFFPKEELKASAGTVVLKQLNWEHGEPIIGTIYSAKFIDPNEDKSIKGKSGNLKSYILVEAVVWKSKYPKLAKKLVNRHKNGVLAFSMEAFFSECECSVCNSKYDSAIESEKLYCSHLKSRHSVYASEDSGVYRILRGILFSGSGVVEDPADVKALSEEVLAKNKTKEGLKLAEDKNYTQDELNDAVKAAVREAVDAATTNANDEQNVAQKMSELEKELKQKTEALQAGSKAIEDLTAGRDEARAELRELKEQLETERLQAQRMAVLEGLGFELPEKEEEAKAALANILSMSEEVFDFYVSTIKAGIGSERKEKKEEPVTASRIPSSGAVLASRRNKKTKASEVGELFSRL